MDTKIVGGILLIVGTTIGGGMLALPVSAAQSGFWSSTFLLFACWALMTFSSFLVLEVNLWMTSNSNLISMVKNTLGKSYAIMTWVFYLLLFYSLLAAYVSGGSDIFHALILKIGLTLPQWASAVIFILLLGLVVYKGIESIDYVNRALMFTKISVYLLLVALIIGFVEAPNLGQGHPKYLVTTVTVMVVSFGYANIIPSLRKYFNGDIPKLRKAIYIGSLIPLVFYIIWDLVILGVVPQNGNFGLNSMLTSGHSTTDIVTSLSHFLNNNFITTGARIFTSVCVATSFLGVGLSLSDFLADGLNVNKKGSGNLIVFIATFAPPLIIALFFPNTFIKGLSYGGVFCMILLVLLPALMVYRGRYEKKISAPYQVMGGKFSIIATGISALAVIAIALYENLHGW